MRNWIIFSLFCSVLAWAQSTQVDEAIQFLKGLNQMREGLASSLDSRTEPITEGTFKQVCMPVGKALKEWGKERGYSVKQVAERNRNPDHALTTEEKPIFALFSRDPKKMSHVVSTTQKGTPGQQVYVRIPVVKSCLHCHGPAGQRPDFIKAKYKDDKAFGFKVGDLRGLYSVFIPEKKEGSR